MTDAAAQLSSTVDALMQEFQIITHNMANVSTVGYKRTCNAFSKSLETQGATGTYAPGETDLTSAIDFSQGNIVETGRPLDFALHGKGFFVIETPDGPLYTRNGVFRTNQNGQVVDSAGRIVAGNTGPIAVPTNVSLSQLHVSNNGSISAGSTNIGRFRLVDFAENESKLVPVGLNCFKMPDEQVTPDTPENVIVKQGYQETSNVKLIDELVDMIMVCRLYEANMKFVSAQKDTSDSIMGVAMA